VGVALLLGWIALPLLSFTDTSLVLVALLGDSPCLKPSSLGVIGLKRGATMLVWLILLLVGGVELTVVMLSISFGIVLPM
jgi:hypothetical protein